MDTRRPPGAPTKSRAWGPQGRTAHLAGSPAAEKRRARCCGWDARGLQVSGGFSGLDGGGRDADRAHRHADSRAAAVRCAWCPAGRLLPCLPAVPPLAPPGARTRLCAPLQAAPLPRPLFPHPPLLGPPFPSARGSRVTPSPSSSSHCAQRARGGVGG